MYIYKTVILHCLPKIYLKYIVGKRCIGNVLLVENISETEEMMRILETGGIVKTLRDICSPSIILHYIISILIGIFLIFVIRYAQEEIHRQGGDLYEFSFRLTADEQEIPEVFFAERENVTLMCYKKQNPMEYILLSGEEDLVPLEENYETVKRGGQSITKDLIFWAVSDRKKALEKVKNDWENALKRSGKSIEPCEGRRITAAGLLGSNQYVYLIYGISWVVLLLFQLGNLMMYIKGRRKTKEVYFLLGIPGYRQKVKRNLTILQILLCIGGLLFLKGYFLQVFVPTVLLFYLLSVIWNILCIKYMLCSLY